MILILPLDILSSVDKQLRSVLFPEPEGPIIQIKSPSSKTKFTLSNA